MKSHSFRQLQADRSLSKQNKPVDRFLEITDSALELTKLNQRVQSSEGENGAAVIFTGNVRLANEQTGLVGMSLEHYPGMTETQLNQIIDNAISRWHLTKVVISHRVGYLMAGEPIVFLGTAGLHRKECFESAEFIMDYLKNDATFWKKEHLVIDSISEERWVEAKQSDIDSIKRWQAN
ncbi:MAG: molybdenum cofactor biosynthesis protein MoaE [Kangiellaceae bacterium]|nr:molybdenum cofactor biosynthesis protein MoaE [Kangiellaceae bacterium]